MLALSKSQNQIKAIEWASSNFKSKQAPYKGSVRSDKVLVLLVEFSDYKHNNIDQTPGYMYSKDFSREHYQKMLFGNEPYTLFDGSKVKRLNNTMKNSLVVVIRQMDM